VGGRFRQDFNNFRKNFSICLGQSLKQNHHPAKLSYSFSSQRHKNWGGLKILPPPLKPKIPAWFWLELSTITMVC